VRLLVNLIYDPEYKGYVADVPELPGCMSQGRTVEQALENVKEAISLYLESAPQEGHTTKNPVLTAVVEV